MDGKSLDIKEEKLNKLKSIIPEAFCENKIDWEKLKAALGEDMEFKNERYVLNWAGKSDAFRVLQSPTTATLVPAKDESVNFDTTENIFIEGENLEVLKVLQKSYFGKIKMIYIDPPYNTGNDTFIYPDKFSETKEEYLSRIGDKDETGYLTREGLFRKNSKDSGYYHSNWLSMMYPRLFLARNLLRDDGVIFVSIDDNEVHNLRLLMNEVFGEENFVGVFCVNSTPNARDYGHIGKMHEYVLFFTKNNVEAATNLIPEVDRKFKYSDEKGGYNIHPLYNSNVAFHSKNRPNLFYPLYLYPDKAIDDDFFEIGLENKISSIEVFPPLSKEGVQFVWRWSKDKVKTNLNREILGYRTGSGEFRVVQKMRHSAKLIRSLLTGKEYSTRRGTAEVEQLFGSKIFSFPKPLELLKEFIISGMAEEDLILDLFAGSATTAHAILDLNKEDGGNRKFIMVQLPEPTSPPVKGDKGGSEAYKAGYKTIAEIGKERIRRVIKTLSPSPSPLTGKGEKEEKEPNLFASSEVLSKGGVFKYNSLFPAEKAENLPLSRGNEGVGFKVFKLKESNFKIWRTKIENEEQLVDQLQQHLEPLDEHAKTENVLYELLLKSGVPLTAKITPPGLPLTGEEKEKVSRIANPEALSERGVFKYNPKLTDRARELRKNPTPAEKKLWENFLKERPQGYKFLRQKLIGNYILDFYCSELLLALEVDGDIHETRKEYDEERDKFLNECGIKVIRIPNNNVANNFDSVKEKISESIKNLPLSRGIEGVYLINDNELALILKKVDEDIIKRVINAKPRKVITLDRLFNNNDQLKTNTALQMKDAEIEFKVV